MPYEGGDLSDFFHEKALVPFAHKAVDDVTASLEKQAVENTPVAVLSPGETVAERGRAPGTMKRRWKRGRLRRRAPDHWSREVFNDDPRSVYVEYDTKPHIIKPRPETIARQQAARRGSGEDVAAAFGGVLRIRNSAGQVIFPPEVHHPGTRGQYMMRRAAIETQRKVEELMKPAVAVWAHEQIARM